MKEDILEQIVDDYYKARGYFTMHNIKYKPEKSHPDYNSKKDAVSSDIDVLAYSPLKKGVERVHVINCKSWQGGFQPEREILNIESNKKISGRESRLRYRDLAMEKWADSLINRVFALTGQRKFVYVMAATLVKGDALKWENNEKFQSIIKNPLKIITMKEMFETLLDLTGTTPASSEIGRLIQVLKASGAIGL